MFLTTCPAVVAVCVIPITDAEVVVPVFAALLVKLEMVFPLVPLPPIAFIPAVEEIPTNWALVEVDVEVK